MQGLDTFTQLAEIAGVFVGFGALIAIRGGGPSDPNEIVTIRAVVWIGLWVIIAGLAPVIVSGYGITGHELWFVSSLLAVATFGVLAIVNRRSPEHQASEAEFWSPSNPWPKRVLWVAGMWTPMLLMFAALVLVVLGLFPDQEAALYLTAVGLGLVMAAFVLLVLVYDQAQSPAAPEQAAAPSPEPPAE